MAKGKQTVNKAPARPEVVTVPNDGSTTGAITVVSDPKSSERVFVSTNPLVAVYPWLGTSVAPGATANLSVAPGSTIYTSAPMGAVSASVTVA